MPSQRRRIQWLRVQKLREEAAERERHEHFNTIRPMILMKQEWWVKEKTYAPTPMTSNDEMDINMVFTLLTELRGVKEEVIQMCLGPQEVVFEKPEESS
jgi:hypothetical protein